MVGIKKLAVVGLALLVLVPVLAAPALGWEFEMTGSMNWAYEYYFQQGKNGFFGRYNADVDGGQAANLNYWWNGPRLSQNIVTGESAGASYLYTILDPTIKINPALRLKSRIRLGQWKNPQASYYNTQDAPGTDNAMSEAQFTQFWATAQLPWGALGAGKRPWKFGTGLQYDGSDGLTTESVLINSGYGPFDYGFGIYAHRPAKRGQTITLDPYDLANFGVQPYFNLADKSGATIYDMLGYAVYNSGPMQMGILGAVANYHIGPEGLLRTGRPFNEESVFATPTRALDSNFFHGTAFVKLNNGRFFFNAEAAWLYWTDRVTGAGVLGTPTGDEGASFLAGANYAAPLFFPPQYLPTPRYTEQWRFMVETGLYAGPAKVSLLYAKTPGPDRRNGQLIDKQSAAFVWHPTFDTFLGNYDVFRPYSFIFTYNYGSGFAAYNLSLDGYLRDAQVLAARLDFAAAANLNVYGTFMYAKRTSNGYGWGCISPLAIQSVAGAGAGSISVADNVDGNVHFNLNGNLGDGVTTLGAAIPNIPDTALGYEINGGVDWQLLDGFTTGLLVGYWQPGKWFNYACIDRSVIGWRNTPGATNNWGTRPDKTIDPIIAGQFTMTFSF
jgi:hypothetical protein